MSRGVDGARAEYARREVPRAAAMKKVGGDLRGESWAVDERAAEEMATMDRCWCCGDTLYVSDAKMVRAKRENEPWVLKIVCVSCHTASMLFRDVRAEVEGEYWTLRPKIVRPGE